MDVELKKAHDAGKLILFAGAGLSANLGLPTWDQLIGHIAKELGYDPGIFATYGDALTLAEYFKIEKGSIGPLRSWLDVNWHNSSIDIASSEIHRLITVGNFRRIYTTNYDRWIENAHDAHDVQYHRLLKAADIATADESRRHIVKLHGDFEDDSSIVLDESSFFARLDFESPLDIKLRHDAIGSSVLFVGYSLSDLNIRLLFYRLTQMWNSATLSTARPKSYLFMQRPNPVATAVLKGKGIEVVQSDADDPKEALREFLEELVS